MLVKLTEVYEFSDEETATQLIDRVKAAQESGSYTVIQAGYKTKDIKVKGEVVGQLFTVTITKRLV